MKKELPPDDQAPDHNSPDYFTIQDLDFEAQQTRFRGVQNEQMARLQDEGGILGKAFLEATSSSQEISLPDDVPYQAGVYRDLRNGHLYGIRFVTTPDDGKKPIVVDVPVYEEAEYGERKPSYPFASVSAEAVSRIVDELDLQRLVGDFPDLDDNLFDLDEPIQGELPWYSE